MLINVNFKEIYVLYINIFSYLSIIGQNHQNSLKIKVFKKIVLTSSNCQKLYV